MPLPKDSRFAEVHAAYLDAWHAGLDTPETPPADAAEFADRLAQARRFFELARTLGPQTPGLPEHVGHFVIRRELGRGGFGIVFLAHHPTLRRDVALKVPRPEALVTAELRARFLLEARAAAMLDHPNIVPVHDAGENGAIFWIASQFIDGPTLRDWLANRDAPVPPMHAVRLAAQIADGLQHAHERGVLHCDVKPGNVLLEDGRPRIADFGLAKLLDDDEQLTCTGAILGAPPYMAPEQFTPGRANLSPQTDIWSLGIVLYELLAGRLPFEGQQPAIGQAIQLNDPPPLRRLRREVSRDLEAVVLMCLEKEPARRYKSMANLAEDLGLVADNQPAKWARPKPWWRKPLRWLRINAARLIAVATIFTLTAIIVTRPDAPANVGPPNATAHEAGPNTGDPSETEPADEHSVQNSERRIVDEDFQAVGKDIVATKDGRIVAIGRDRRVRHWDAATKLLWRSKPYDYADDSEVALSADGKRLVTMDFKVPEFRVWGFDLANPKVRVWDLDTQKLVFEMRISRDRHGARNVAISPNGEWVAFGGQIPNALEKKGDVRLLHVKSGRCSTVFQDYQLCGMCFSHDSSRLAITTLIEPPSGPHKSCRQLFALNVSGTFQRDKPVVVPSGYFSAGLEFSPDMLVLLEGYDNGSFRHTHYVNANLDVPISGRLGKVAILKFDPNGKYFAACAKVLMDGLKCDNHVYIYDADTRAIIRQFKVKRFVDCLCFTRDGNTLMYGSPEGVVCVTVKP